jgi:hypothetical protein
MEANYTTIGKPYFSDQEKGLSLEKAKRLMLEEHSTLAFAPFIVSGEFRGDVIQHLVRSTKGLPRFAVQSTRPDWSGKPRPSPDTLRKMWSLWNPLSWMAMCNQRLCHKAMKETRETIDGIREEMATGSESYMFFKALAWASVPTCVARGGCPYRKSCGFYDNHMDNVVTGSVTSRYNDYSAYMENK